MVKTIDEINSDMAELTELVTKTAEELTDKINSASLDLNNRIDALSLRIDSIQKGVLGMIDVIHTFKK